MSKTLKLTDKLTENYSSPLLVLRNISQVLSSTLRLLSNPLSVEPSSFSFLLTRESSLVSRLIKVLRFSPELMTNPPPWVWIPQTLWLRSTTLSDADSLSGELSSRSPLTVHPLNKLSKKTLGVLQDTELSAKLTDSFLSSSLRFSSMESTPLKPVRKSPRESLQLLLRLFLLITFSGKDVSLNPTWSPLALRAPPRPLLLKSLSAQSLHFQELSHLLSSVCSS